MRNAYNIFFCLILDYWKIAKYTKSIQLEFLRCLLYIYLFKSFFTLFSIFCSFSKVYAFDKFIPEEDVLLGSLLFFQKFFLEKYSKKIKSTHNENNFFRKAQANHRKACTQ